MSEAASLLALEEGGPFDFGGLREERVQRCLDEMGPLPVKDETREELVSHAREQGDLSWDDDSYRESAVRASEMLSLIASTREYQFG